MQSEFKHAPNPILAGANSNSIAGMAGRWAVPHRVIDTDPEGPIGVHDKPPQETIACTKSIKDLDIQSNVLYTYLT